MTPNTVPETGEASSKMETHDYLLFENANESNSEGGVPKTSAQKKLQELRESQIPHIAMLVDPTDSEEAPGKQRVLVFKVSKSVHGTIRDAMRDQLASGIEDDEIQADISDREPIDQGLIIKQAIKAYRGREDRHARNLVMRVITNPKTPE